MDENSPPRPAKTEVEIFGGVYKVRGRNDGDYLRQIAADVDRTMREVAGQVQTVDTSRIAILAALNLADELSQCRKRLEGERDEIQEKAASLAGELTAALEA
jgi:cell division protein ZapA